MFAKYIGIPFVDSGRDFNGCDCWGLIWLFYKNELGIYLPSYSGDYKDIKDIWAIRNLIKHEKKAEWIQVNSPKQFDAVLLRIENNPQHCGMMVDNVSFLHVDKGVDSCIEKTTKPLWKNRILGFYRHEQLAD